MNDFDWSIDSIEWLTDWMMNYLNNLIDWLIDKLIILVDFTDWSSEWLTDQLIHLQGFLIHYDTCFFRRSGWKPDYKEKTAMPIWEKAETLDIVNKWRCIVCDLAVTPQWWRTVQCSWPIDWSEPPITEHSSNLLH